MTSLPAITARSTVFLDTEAQSAQRVACFPDLLKLADGRILCSFRVGTSKDSADETIRIRESSDGGASWQDVAFEPATSLHGVPGSLRTGRLTETAPGVLLLIANWVNRSQPELAMANPQTAGCLEMRVVAFHSRDGGESWSEAQEISGFPFPQPEVSGAAICLKTPGHLLLPLENQKTYNDQNPIDEKAYAMLSFDSGESWPEWAMIAHDHPARKFWCNRAIKFPSGKLAVLSWTFDNITERDLPLHLTFGSSDGREWSTPFSTGIDGQVSALLCLDESTLLMSTSHRESPAGIRLRRSFDGGKTWDENGLLVLDAESQAAQNSGGLADYYQVMTSYTFGWSPMVRLDDHLILLVYFAGSPESIGIYGARITL